MTTEMLVLLSELQYALHLFRYRLGYRMGWIDASRLAERKQRLRHKYLDCDERVSVPFRRGWRFIGKKFLLIRREDPGAGLFSHFITSVGWMKYAEEHGYIPIVDMTESENMYRDPMKPGVNPWEAFFEQSGGYRLEDVSHAFCVAVAGGNTPSVYPNVAVSTMSGEVVSFWRGVVARHCRVRPDIMTEAIAAERRLFGERRKVLGVLLRGTDYVAMRPAGHPVQPDPVNALEDVAARYASGGFDWVFLVTEDARIEALFRKRFGDRLRMTDQRPIDYPGSGWIRDLDSCRMNLEMAREYLLRIVLLSRCGTVMCAGTSGAVGAALLSKGFDGAFYWDEGRYPVRNTDGRGAGK